MTRNEEASHHFRGLKERGITNSSDFIGVSIGDEISRANAVLQKLDLVLDGEALLKIELDACVLEETQKSAEMLQLFLFVLREDCHVFQVHKAHSEPHARRDDVERMLECRRRVANS